MKQRRKIAFLMVVVTVLMCVASPLSVSGAEPKGESTVMPRLNNTMMTNENFVIVDGVATVGVAYTGYSGVTTSATVTIKLQRKVLFWWSDVDNGLADNTWVIFMSGWSNTATKSLALEKTGEYRAVIEYTITGSGGANDVIPVTLYYDY